MPNQTSNSFQFKTNLSLFMCVLFFTSLFVHKQINTIVGQRWMIVHTDTSIHLNFCCLCVLSYSSFLYTCVCVFLHIQSSLRECRSIRSGASGLPYYCAPLVCVSDVMELLAVWWHNKPKTKNQSIRGKKNRSLSYGPFGWMRTNIKRMSHALSWVVLW